MWFTQVKLFEKNWIMIAINPLKKEEIVIVNNNNELKNFYHKNKNEIFIGYNIKQYDQYLIKAVLSDLNPIDVSNYILKEKKAGWHFSRKFNYIKLNVFDISTSYTLDVLNGFMGEELKEPTKLIEAIDKCKNDVKQIIKIFLQNQEEFDTYIQLIKMFNLSIDNIKRTKAQLSSYILEAKKENRTDEFNISIPNNLKISKYKEVLDWYKNKNNINYNKSLNVMVANTPHTFGWGGLHGARKNYIATGEFVNIDVISYYPSLMIEYDYLSRNIKNKDKFKNIYKQRLEYKRTNDKRQQPLKIVLNATYGAMKDRYNDLYDPLQANNVCVAGQLFLLDLIEKLEQYCQIIQSNTDGLLIKINGNKQKIYDICKEWEQRTKMKLSYDKYKKIIQKDVNNYLFIKEDGTYKSKGAFVKELTDLNNNLPIINKAITNYLINGISPEKTIKSCNDLKDFQIILSVSENYEYATHNNTKLNEKTLRVFASLSRVDGCIYKVRNNTKTKFADAPENCFIINNNVNNLKCPININKQWYIDLAKRRIKMFVGE